MIVTLPWFALYTFFVALVATTMDWISARPSQQRDKSPLLIAEVSHFTGSAVYFGVRSSFRGATRSNWLGIVRSVAVFSIYLLFAVCITGLVDIWGHLSPSDAHVPFASEASPIFLSGVTEASLLALLLGTAEMRRRSLRPRIAAAIRGFALVSRRHFWSMLSVLFLISAIVAIGKLIPFQYFHNPDDTVRVMVKSWKGTIGPKPSLDVIAQDLSVTLNISVTAAASGYVLIGIDHIRAPGNCKVAFGDAVAGPADMHLGNWTLSGDGQILAEFRSLLYLKKGTQTTLQCPLDDAIQPSGDFRRLDISSVWLQNVRLRPDKALYGYLKTVMPTDEALEAASTANMPLTGISIGSIDLNSAVGFSQRWVNNPELDSSGNRTDFPERWPPSLRIEWEDEGARTTQGLFELCIGAIVALALAMLIEDLRPSVEAIRRKR